MLSKATIFFLRVHKDYNIEFKNNKYHVGLVFLKQYRYAGGVYDF